MHPRRRELGIAAVLLCAMAATARSRGATVSLFVQPEAAPSPQNQTGPSPPFTPAQIQQAYGVSSLAANGAGQTIAIIDAYNYPNAISALNTFSTQWGLPTFNGTGGPTFTQLSQSGTTTLPATDPNTGSANGDWETEEALDIEWAHVMAPQANIILYEATSAGTADLYSAVGTAENNPAVSVVSMSFSSSEFGGERSQNGIFRTPASRLNASPNQGVTFVASTGDTGPPSGYPATSPNVLAVGGTSLTINASNNYVGETPWNNSYGAGGGGTSAFEPQPSYQASYGALHGGVLSTLTKRATPDVSFDADPATGVYVYDPYNADGGSGWFQDGGTSLGSPAWSGLIADADQIRSALGYGTLDGLTQTLPALYSLPASDFNDITSGTIGDGILAGIGYDEATGLGTPVANLLVPGLADYGIPDPAPVPEPSTMVLLGMAGVIGIGGVLWQKRVPGRKKPTRYDAGEKLLGLRR